MKIVFAAGVFFGNWILHDLPTGIVAAALTIILLDVAIKFFPSLQRARA